MSEAPQTTVYSYKINPSLKLSYISGIAGAYISLYETVLGSWMQFDSWKYFRVTGIASFILLTLVLLVIMEKKSILSFLKMKSGQQSAIGVLYYFSLQFLLVTSLLSRNKQDGILKDIIVIILVTLGAIVIYFLVPKAFRWKSNSPHEWPLYTYSLIAGFLPAVVSWTAVHFLNTLGEWDIYYLGILVALGALISYMLGFSHPRNVVSDKFMAQYLLVASTFIFIGIGLLAIGALMFLYKDAKDYLAMFISHLAYMEFVLSFTGLILVYRYQYQTVTEIDSFMESGKRYFELGKYTEAIKVFSKALDFWKYNPRALYHRSQAYMGLGLLREAKSDLERAKELAIPRNLKDAINNELKDLEKTSLPMIKRFFGVNVAIKDLESATRRFTEVLGVKPTAMTNADFAFPNLVGSQFTLGNDVVIRLIASQTSGTAIARFLDSRGEGVFLITVETNDVEKEMLSLARMGVQLIGSEPIQHISGKVGFIHPRSLHGVQLELFQPKSD